MAQSTSFEERIHQIYEKHYQTPLLDSDWFKIISGVEEQTYKVRAGDTLWGISEIYFGDGHYWSKLWSVNRSITNPHLILVGDSIHFKAGTFENAPGVEVKKNENGEPLQEASSSPVMEITESKKTFYEKLPEYFKESPKLELEENKVSVKPRPPIIYKNSFYLTEEIFNEKPNVMAYVKSLGNERMVSGEANRLILQSESQQQLGIGSELSVIDEKIRRISGGYAIKILAVVKVQRAFDGLYEAEIVRQFDAIYKDSVIINSLPLYASLKAEEEPIEAKVKVISYDKEIWSMGDRIFLRQDGSDISVGQLLKINNKFDRKIDFYLHNGTIKIVSVHPPYATAVVVHSNTAIDRSSVSDPSLSGNGFWSF